MSSILVNRWLLIAIGIQFFAHKKVYKFISLNSYTHNYTNNGQATASHVLFTWSIMMLIICIIGRSYVKIIHNNSLKEYYTALCVLNGLAVLLYTLFIGMANDTSSST